MSQIKPLGKRRRKKLQNRVDEKLGYRSYHDGDVAVKSTGADSLGIYAVRQFTPGELVMEIRGQVLAKASYEGSTYVMELDDDWYLEPAIPASFLNHSCNPNSELVQLSKLTMGLVAICNIEEGSQITFDYCWPALKWIPRCECGSPNCRGWVVAQDEVEKMKKIARRKGKRKAS
ncbi:SET domain protein [Planctomycetes bacterium CA13]|uniref:SET domain protein n=1 Tax=Novipirellula herctigrandis TaxID=2527986 RepID=A0A5C5YY91_9BACT|nr:SET domain protein [Planctomycetes bacterium CA13]